MVADKFSDVIQRLLILMRDFSDPKSLTMKPGRIPFAQKRSSRNAWGIFYVLSR